MRYSILLILLAAFIGGCAGTGSTSGGGGLAKGAIDPDAPEEVKERQAYEVIGDVRVFYYIKPALIQGGFRTTEDGESVSGPQVQQKEQRHILANKSHNAYMTKADQDIASEVSFLRNADMYDLLIALKALGFFQAGNSVNIFNDDVFARADREQNTTRVIAVQVIKDGNVNTSYFARHEKEADTNEDRALVFNKCQAAVMVGIARALPRGTAGYGKGDTDKIHKQR